jgi:hypothetical protein
METIGYLDLIGLTGLLVISTSSLFALVAWYEERKRNENEKTTCEDNSDSDSGDTCGTE